MSDDSITVYSKLELSSPDDASAVFTCHGTSVTTASPLSVGSRCEVSYKVEEITKLVCGWYMGSSSSRADLMACSMFIVVSCSGKWYRYLCKIAKNGYDAYPLQKM